MPVCASTNRGPILRARGASSLLTIALFGAEHGDGFDFDEELGTAEMRLDPSRCRKWIEALFPEEPRALVVEGGIVAVDVAEVAGGADDVLPGCTFRFQKPGDVVVGAALLRAEVADVNGV